MFCHLWLSNKAIAIPCFNVGAIKQWLCKHVPIIVCWFVTNVQSSLTLFRVSSTEILLWREVTQVRMNFYDSSIFGCRNRIQNLMSAFVYERSLVFFIHCWLLLNVFSNRKLKAFTIARASIAGVYGPQSSL